PGTHRVVVPGGPERPSLAATSATPGRPSVQSRPCGPRRRHPPSELREQTTEFEAAMNKSPSSVNVLEPPSTQADPERRPAPPPADRPSPAGARPSWLRRTVPSLLVIAALGGLGYLGHHTGWTIPTFAQLTGSGQTAKDDWCQEHSVPE